MSFEDALLPYIAIAYEKQLFLASILGDDHRFDFNMNAGTMTFNNKDAYSIQILGTEAHDAQTWLWGWANAASGIPEKLLQSGMQLKAYGEEHSMDALTRAEIPLDAAHNGHAFSLFASGILKVPAYYSAGYDGGALYVLIDDPTFPTDERDPMQRIATTFPQLIAGMTLANQYLAFKGYLRAHNIAIQSESESEIVAKATNGQTLTAEFDEHHRLTNLSGKFHN